MVHGYPNKTGIFEIALRWDRYALLFQKTGRNPDVNGGGVKDSDATFSGCTTPINYIFERTCLASNEGRLYRPERGSCFRDTRSATNHCRPNWQWEVWLGQIITEENSVSTQLQGLNLTCRRQSTISFQKLIFSHRNSTTVHQAEHEKASEYDRLHAHSLNLRFQ